MLETLYIIVLYFLLAISYSLSVSLIIKREEATRFNYYIVFYVCVCLYILLSIGYIREGIELFHYLKIMMLVLCVVSLFVGLKNKAFIIVNNTSERYRLYLIGIIVIIASASIYSIIYMELDITPLFFTIAVLITYLIQFVYGVSYNIQPFANRQVINNMDEYVILIDKKGYIVKASSSIRELFLKDKIEIIGKKSTDFFDYINIKETQEIGFICFIRLESVKEEAFTFKIRKITGHKNEDLGKILIIKNITNIYNLEKRLEKARENIIKATEEKSMFLASLSHEVRTPMNAILGMASFFLSNNAHKEKEVKIVQEIEEMGKKLYTMVNNLLDYSKIEAKQMNIDKIEIDIDKLIEENSNNKRIKIKTYDLPKVIGDYNKLMQIIYLIPDYLDADVNKEEIYVSIKIIDEKMIIKYEIEDKEELINELFELFLLNNSSKILAYNKSKNTLNIALWLELVKLLGGKYYYKKNENKFTLEVIMRIKTQDEEIKKVSLDKNDSVLIVDDNAINRKIIGMLLVNIGIDKIDYAENGEKAYEMAKNYFYKIIFMDCYMPIMDGYTAAQKIIEDQMDLKEKSVIVAVTANDLLEDKERCLAIGINKYLTKPLNANKLFSIIKFEEI